MASHFCKTCSTRINVAENAPTPETCPNCGETVAMPTGFLSCPEDGVLTSYLKDELKSCDAQAVEAHVEKCVGCEERLAAFTDDEVNVTADGAEETRECMPEKIGRYLVRSRLGEGGFGCVYLCHDEQLERVVAVKVPRVREAVRLDGPGGILAEARTLASLDHPNIVRIFDIQLDDDVQPYIVSQFIDGQTLNEWAPEIEWRKAAAIIETLASALASAHEKRIVHRDIKPSNILIDNQGTPVLVDFGIALRDVDYGDPQWQAGTLGYLSPEQARGDGHLVDGRSDIFSLGVVLYELLVGSVPFGGASAQDVLERVQRLEPRPPRQTKAQLPRELERVCLKCLEKRPSDRYSNAADLADDLRQMLENESRNEGSAEISEFSPVRIVPRGLRSYDAEDADFFVHLLPGPRDRFGVPEVVSFWKSRCEQRDPDRSFRVALLYGPSGCGKSSFVKAGLIPRLSNHVVSVHVESSADKTVHDIKRALVRQFDFVDPNSDVVHVLKDIRKRLSAEGRRKVVLFLDQFEQWFGGQHRDQEMLAVLRQCDGNHLACVILLRDEYWMASTRLMQEIEIPIRNENCRAFDLFDGAHAKKVLASIGEAFGRLPDSRNVDAPANQFLDESISELSNADDRVSPIQLAVFAEMLKTRPWTPDTLTNVGGARGVGVQFLDEMFNANSAPPHYRVHKAAAKSVLRSLLPPVGSSIRGAARRRRQLRQDSEYQNDSEFDDLMRILESELHLVSPLQIDQSEFDSNEQETNYQLTHDYLVPSIREWLNRDDKKTVAGRARRLLIDRTEAWRDSPVARQLPSLTEFARICLYTKSAQWDAMQRSMMAMAKSRHLRRVVFSLVACVAIVLAFVSISNSKKKQHAELLVNRLADARPELVAPIVDELENLGPLATELLTEHIASSTSRGRPDWPGLAMTRFGGEMSEATLAWLMKAELDDLFAVQQTFADGLPPAFDRQLRQILRNSQSSSRAMLNATCLLSYSRDQPLELDADTGMRVCSAIDAMPPRQQLARYLWNASASLISPLRRTFEEGPVDRANNAAEWLLVLAPHDIDVLVSVATERDDEYFRRTVELLPDSSEVGPSFLRTFDSNISLFKSNTSTATEKEIAVARTVRAAIGLIGAGQSEYVWPILLSENDPRLRARLISKASVLGVDPRVIVARLQTTDASSRLRAALLLMLSTFDNDALPENGRRELIADVCKWFVEDQNAGVHGAARCLLTAWDERERVEELEANIQRSSCCSPGHWFVDETLGGTMVRVDVTDFLMGTDPPPFPSESQHLHRINRSIALGATEITVGLFQAYVKERGPASFSDFAVDQTAVANPQVGINWHQAAGFCNWLSEKAGLSKNEWCYESIGGNAMRAVAGAVDRSGYRLPTEAEWEFACRAGTSTLYFHGETAEFLSEYGWYGDRDGIPKPIATLMPNEFGLFDMYGNALEWCHGFPASYRNPTKASIKRLRAQRGGHSGQLDPKLVRSAIRYSELPELPNSVYGLRVARTLTSE